MGPVVKDAEGWTDTVDDSEGDDSWVTPPQSRSRSVDPQRSGSSSEPGKPPIPRPSRHAGKRREKLGIGDSVNEPTRPEGVDDWVAECYRLAASTKSSRQENRAVPGMPGASGAGAKSGSTDKTSEGTKVARLTRARSRNRESRSGSLSEADDDGESKKKVDWMVFVVFP